MKIKYSIFPLLFFNLDQVKVHYRNVSSEYDEWIDRGSERIRRFGPFRSMKVSKSSTSLTPIIDEEMECSNGYKFFNNYDT